MISILKKAGLGIVILLGYALAMQVFLNVNVIEDFERFRVYTAVLAGLFVMGFLIVSLSPEHDTVRKHYAMTAPWVPIGIIYFFLLIWSWYIWMGLTMILPVPLAFASLGGRFARRWIIRRKRRLSRTRCDVKL